MRKIRIVMHMKFGLEMSNAVIAKSVDISGATVFDYLQRATLAQLSWPLPEELDDEQIELLLFPPKKSGTNEARGEIDWGKMHKELKRKNVTLQLLWLEYREENSKGYGYSRFCGLYHAHKKQLDLWMRQHHRAGEKAFVDYCGQTMSLVSNNATGETIEVQIIVIVLGASGYSYVEATLSQTLPDWLGSHRRAFEFFGGVPELLVPDNLKSGVTKCHRYDPDSNPSYHELARHYNTAIMPARSRSPQDKAKAEQMVQQVERQVMAALRDQKFFTLHEMNQAIWERMEQVNAKPFQKMPGSRHSLFEEIDKPALKALPARPYEFGEWKYVLVDGSYHVEVDGHYYSVPYKHARKKIDIRFSATIVQCFFKGKEIALHQRSKQKGGHTTLFEHMPKSHQKYAEWTPERVQEEAEKIGPSTKALTDAIFAERNHHYIASRACLGIIRLAKCYTEKRLEAACQRALIHGLLRCNQIESILKNGLDDKPLPDTSVDEKASVTQHPHKNIRDVEYYQ